MSRDLELLLQQLNSVCRTGSRSHLHSVELQGPQRLSGSSGQCNVDLTGKVLQGLGFTTRQHDLHS